jgi:hypothetical protein
MNNRIRDRGRLSVCPNCNAPLPPNERNEVVCAYCGTALVHRGPAVAPPRLSRPEKLARRHKAIAVPRPGVPSRARISRALVGIGLILFLVGACPVLLSAPRGWPAQLAGLVRLGRSGKEMTVPSQKEWHASGLCVRPGQTVTVVYLGGTWSVWGGAKQQADGAGHAGEYRDRLPVPGAPAGALIGRIGEDRPFYVGNHLTLTTRQAGVLWLGINDYWHADNTGALRVAVTVGSRP